VLVDSNIFFLKEYIMSDSKKNNIDEILANIEKLQNTEQQLIRELDIYTSENGGFISTDPKIQELLKKINNIAESRILMFNIISNNANILQTGVSQSRVDLVNQMTLLNVVEDQLNQAKQKIKQLNGKNDTKMRMVQINTYYGQRYEAHSEIMKKIIIICVPILILFILKKKGLIPETISNYLIGVVIAVGAFVLIQDMWDIFTRSNMNFTEYDWKYEDPMAQAPSIWEYNKKNFFNFDDLFSNLMENLGLCIGDKCCSDGLTFDTSKQKCLIPEQKINPLNPLNASSAAVTDTFTTMNNNGNMNMNNNESFVSGYFDDLNDKKDSFNGISPNNYDNQPYATY
jgi:hypothetical protein